jgi:hypothetical protein
MPPAASVFFRSLLPALAVLRIASAAPSVLIDDDFSTADDSLWNFRTAAFKDGVLSPGLEADPRGRTDATGQLRVDASASALRFVPRHGVKAHRSCFLGYRSDFRIEDVYASKVEVEIGGEVINPAAGDSTGGLFVLVRYENEVGIASLARTMAGIRSPRTVAIDTSALIPIGRTDWFSLAPLEGERLAQARSHIIGLGLCYISRNGSSSGSQALLVGGFKARGEVRWPDLPGHPEETEIMADDTVALAWSFPPGLKAEFQWYRNGKPVPSAQGPRYVFRPGPDDARIHDFHAEIRLPNGDNISTGRIRVKVLRPAPPIIALQSGDTAVPVGGTALFRISASGLQPLSYQWYRNGKPIAGAKGAIYPFVTSNAAEGGQFRCEVKDKQGRTAWSRSAALLVQPGSAEEDGIPQALSMGVKVGLNVSDFYRDEPSSAPSQPKVNFLQAGAGAIWQWNPAWALGADLLFTRKGASYDFPDHSSVYDLDYLEMPVLLRARLGKWLPTAPVSLLAGGYGSVLVSAERQDDWDTWKGTQSMDDIRTFDYGAMLGLSWQIGLFSMECRYGLGLAELGTGGSGEPRMNGTISAMLGWTLFTAEGPR